MAEKTKLNPPALVEVETVLVTLDTLELCILLSDLVVETPKLKPGKPGAVVAEGVVNVGIFVTEVVVVAIKLVSFVILGSMGLGVLWKLNKICITYLYEMV